MGRRTCEGGVSSASGVRLNETDLQTIRAAAPDDVLLCPDSNAILVRTERIRHLMARTLIVEADGGSRGNPGLSGSGAVVIDPRVR